MISARLVTAAGKCIDVSADENADLWWGLRGAGHNFGIISSLTLKAYPELNEGMHWISLLVFTPDKIEDVIKAINRLDFDKGLALHIFFMPVPPNFQVYVIFPIGKFLGSYDLVLSCSFQTDPFCSLPSPLTFGILAPNLLLGKLLLLFSPSAQSSSNLECKYLDLLQRKSRVIPQMGDGSQTLPKQWLRELTLLPGAESPYPYFFLNYLFIIV